MLCQYIWCNLIITLYFALVCKMIYRRILVLALRGVCGFVLFLIRCFSIFSPGCRKPDPPIDPLLLTSATELARRIRHGQLRSTVLVQSFIFRIQQVNPVLNAMVCDRFAEALNEARIVDDLVSSGTMDNETLRDKYPLLGIPFTVKEAFALKGMPQSSGLLSRRLVRSQTDAAVVSRLKRAGAIPLGVTNCSELCMWYESSNKVYGRTRNPYNPQHIVGGSSGGEGCILAASGSVIGVGSDIGGSIRMPAFFNGIYGHKPTTGVVPNEGQFPNAYGCRSEFLCTGPMCRYAIDLKPVLKVMAGKNVVRLSLEKKVSLSNLRYFSMENDGGGLFVSRMDKELILAQRKSFADLLSGGNRFWPSWELLKWIFGVSKHTLPAIGLALTEKLANTSHNGKERMERIAKLLKEEIKSLLGDNGILIYPSHPKVAPRHNEPLAMPFNFAYTGIFNVLGFPVTQCPLGLSQTGLPLGIQLIASHYNDHLTLALAQYLETTLGGWIPPGSEKHL
ncbi:fatty-acid amide hydrolase 2 isoform X2 [Spea bombifrons]|uniref:fatty-acid amide hydrolase 2 isoform X2 n=1 Tax=Spea bombifrons TaxID=233779 RepID=UPI00234A8DE9|nr:fatty-acid amide hydrolase 2 isoform X2 [Spea bombifrons]